MTEELQKKAEDFIIERYKIAKCYREDNAETREYMRMDVHSQYEEEYQLYLAATKELQEENAELKKDNEGYDKDNVRLVQQYNELSKENAELKKDKKELCHSISEGGKACVYLNEQLTKAKELLEKLLITSCNSDVLNLLSNCSEVLRVRAEAEQFLSEVPKWVNIPD